MAFGCKRLTADCRKLIAESQDKNDKRTGISQSLPK
jgi:hypothetical protein